MTARLTDQPLQSLCLVDQTPIACCAASGGRLTENPQTIYRACVQPPSMGSRPWWASHPSHRCGNSQDQAKTWARWEHIRTAPCTSTTPGTAVSRCGRSPVGPTWSDFDLAPSRQTRLMRLTKHAMSASCPKPWIRERMTGMRSREPARAGDLGSGKLPVHS